LSSCTKKLSTNFKYLQNHYLYFDEIESTNAYLLQTDFENGIIVQAGFQSKGRGRKKREWQSLAGQSLLFSIGLNEKLDQLPGFIYTFLSSLAVAETIDSIFPSLNPILKWPNDVLINHKKVCGILVETKANSQELNKVVIGIGLNVNQNEDYFSKPDLQFGTSLKIETGGRQDREIILTNILRALDENLNLALKFGSEPILNRWRQMCPYLSREITLIEGEKSMTGKFVDIASDGALLLQVDGQTEKIYAGDVSFDKRSL